MEARGAGAGAGAGRRAGAKWAGAGHEGRREVAAAWEQREAALREHVADLWDEHATAFAAHWRRLHQDPSTIDLRHALLLTALHDLLHPEENDDDDGGGGGEDQHAEDHQAAADNDRAMPGSEDEGRGGRSPVESALEAVVMGACPELFGDLQTALLDDPERLIALMEEPHTSPREQEEEVSGGLHTPAMAGTQTTRSDGATSALRSVRRWCLLQLGCNMLLLYLNGPNDEEADEESSEG